MNGGIKQLAKTKMHKLDDEDMIRTFEGDIKCLKCVETDSRKMMIRVLGPEHPKNKDFLVAEQKKVDLWNNYANKWNDINKKMGGNKDILKLKRNPYLT